MSAVRQPTVSSDSVAHDQIKAFVERIERMNEERKAIAKDVAEIYAEARGNGFDTKALKIIIREREKDPNELMELEAIVELYKAALGMAVAPRDYGRDDDEDETGTPVATRAPAHAIPAHDPITGEIIDTEFVQADQGSESDDRTLAAEPMPETANQSTAALKEVPGSLPVIENGPVLSENGGRYPVKGEAKVLAASSEVPGTPAGTQAPPVDTHSETHSGEAGVNPVSAGAQLTEGASSDVPSVDTLQAGGEDVAGAADNAGGRDSLPAAATNVFAIPPTKPMRPLCRNPGPRCAGQGRQHCYACQKAAADDQGLTA